MARKRVLLVSEYESSRRGWVLKLQSTVDEIRQAVIKAIMESAAKLDMLIVNAKNPFGDDIPMVEEKKTRKPRSDKGAKRAATGDGQEGSVNA